VTSAFRAASRIEVSPTQKENIVKKPVTFATLIFLAGLLGLTAASCGSDKSASDRAAPKQGPSTPKKPVGDGRHFGYIEAAKAQPPTISFDVAQLLTGEAANRAAAEDGSVEPGEPVPNDYYVRNPDRQTEALNLAKDVQITAAAPVTRLSLPPETRGRCRSGCTEAIPVTLADFVASFRKRKDALSAAGGPFWVTIEDGLVVRIDEQYFP